MKTNSPFCLEISKNVLIVFKYRNRKFECFYFNSQQNIILCYFCCAVRLIFRNCFKAAAFKFGKGRVEILYFFVYF